MFFGISLILFGSFFEFSSCILTIIMCVYIMIDKKMEKTKFRINITLLALMLIPIMYLISAICAVDYGMAIIGFVKFLPIIPISIYVATMQVEERLQIIKSIPKFASVMTLASFGLSLIPSISSYINVNSNLAGFFQYPNTYALFLVVSLMIIIDDFGEIKNKIILNLAQSLLLLIALVLTQSRTALVLLIVLLFISLFSKKTRKNALLILVIGIVIAVVMLAVLFLTSDFSAISKYFSITIYESTFIGRILYAVDVLPQILTNPLGLGYYGYSYTQGEFQTGLYSIVYVHNDFLQMFIDAGWVAGVALIFVVVKSLLAKTLPSLNKMMILTISLFTLFDFHLQYISIFFILILCLDYQSLMNFEFKKMKIVKPIIAGLVVISFYFGFALVTEYFGANDISINVYPLNTRIKIEYLFECEDVSELGELADDIIKQNEYCVYAYEAKANFAYSQYDFNTIIESKLKEIELSKFDLEKYTELIDFLAVGVILYEDSGDSYSSEYCKKIIQEVPTMITEAESQLSKLGLMIDDQPYLTLSDEYVEYINSLS